MPQKALRTATVPRGPRRPKPEPAEESPLVDLEPRPFGGFEPEDLYGGERITFEEEEEPEREEEIVEEQVAAPAPVPHVPQMPRQAPLVDHAALAVLRNAVSPIMPAATHALGQLQQIREQEGAWPGVIPTAAWRHAQEAQRHAAALFEEVGKMLWLLRPGG